MSRVGKKPIPIPDKTKVTYKDRVITVQAEKGTLTRTLHPAVDLKIEDNVINVIVIKDDRVFIYENRLRAVFFCRYFLYNRKIVRIKIGSLEIII